MNKHELAEKFYYGFVLDATVRGIEHYTEELERAMKEDDSIGMSFARLAYESAEQFEKVYVEKCKGLF